MNLYATKCETESSKHEYWKVNERTIKMEISCSEPRWSYSRVIVSPVYEVDRVFMHTELRLKGGLKMGGFFITGNGYENAMLEYAVTLKKQLVSVAKKPIMVTVVSK